MRDHCSPLTDEDIQAMCAGKQVFESPALAHEVARSRRKGCPREVYRCLACNGFHIGKPLERPTKPERRQLKRPRNRNGIRNKLVRE